MTWPETVIDTPHGRTRAVAPLVISASRATDLPAFHAAWFMKRLRAGFCLWQNPFNPAQRQWISFERCRVFVFWSKNPAPLLPHLPELASRGHEFYVHFTLNDYEGTGLEPNLPPLARRVETFRQLSALAGRKRVIWRFDPIILGGGLTVESTLARLSRLAEALSPFTETLIFSFVDWYRKTARNLGRLNPDFRPPTLAEMQALARGVAAMNRALPRPLKLAACAEPLDLTGLGIERGRCVDPVLLHRLCPDCETFARWCGKKRGPARLSLLDAAAESATTARNADEKNGAPKTGTRATTAATTQGADKKAKSAAFPQRPDDARAETTLPENARPKTRQEAKPESAPAGTSAAAGSAGPGRRPACGCAPSKDVGAYDTCRHFCAYCYANRSKRAVEATLAALSPDDEAL